MASSSIAILYRSTVHSSTGFSPHLLVFARETRLPIDLVAPTIAEEGQSTRSQFAESMKKRFEKTYELTRASTQKACNRYKDYYDANSKEATYKVRLSIQSMVTCTCCQERQEFEIVMPMARTLYSCKETFRGYLRNRISIQ